MNGDEIDIKVMFVVNRFSSNKIVKKTIIERTLMYLACC